MQNCWDCKNFADLNNGFGLCGIKKLQTHRYNLCEKFEMISLELDYEELDSGIARYVKILNENGIETYESCEGGIGHCCPEPMVRFHGEISEGYRAAAIAIQNDLRPDALRRFWSIIDNELVGPSWEMTFIHKDDQKE